MGGWRDAASQSLLETEKVGAILNVVSDQNDSAKREANKREQEYCSSHKIAYCNIPLKDFTAATDEQFVAGIAFIERNVRLDRKVLVHCGMGLGRSPSFVAAHLLYKGYNSETAITLIKNKRDQSCFEGYDEIHVDRIREFEKELPNRLEQIGHMTWCFSDSSILDCSLCCLGECCLHKV